MTAAAHEYKVWIDGLIDEDRAPTVRSVTGPRCAVSTVLTDIDSAAADAGGSHMADHACSVIRIAHARCIATGRTIDFRVACRHGNYHLEDAEWHG